MCKACLEIFNKTHKNLLKKRNIMTGKGNRVILIYDCRFEYNLMRYCYAALPNNPIRSTPSFTSTEGIFPPSQAIR